MAKQKETIGFKDVLADLKKGLIYSVYVFEGDEYYLKGKILKALETLLIEPSVRSLDYLSADYSNSPAKVNFPQLQSAIKTPPFLSKRKMVVLKNTGLFTMGGSSKKQNRDESEEASEDGDVQDVPETASAAKDRQSMLISLIQASSDFSCLIFMEDKVDKRMKAVLETVQKTGVLASIVKPDLREIRQWVKSEFARKDLSIAPDDCDYLIERNDGSLQNMVGEIEKIALLAKAEKKQTVERDVIEAIGSSDLKGSVFDMVDALSKKNVQEAYRLLDLLLMQRQPIQLISFMLARHIRQLIAAKELGGTEAIIKRMKVIPFVANKLYYQAKNFTFDALEYLYQQCYESDLAVKTSKISDRLALEILFANTVDKISPDPLNKRAE